MFRSISPHTCYVLSMKQTNNLQMYWDQSASCMFVWIRFVVVFVLIMQQVQLALSKELFFNVLFFQIQDIVHMIWAQSRIQLVSTFPILSRVCVGCVICDHSSTLLPKWMKRDKYPLSSSVIKVWNTKTTGWKKVKYCWEQIWRGRSLFLIFILS